MRLNLKQIKKIEKLTKLKRIETYMEGVSCLFGKVANHKNGEPFGERGLTFGDNDAITFEKGSENIQNSETGEPGEFPVPEEWKKEINKIIKGDE